MSDASFARLRAGAGFRRADTVRDERAVEPVRPIEDFLGGLVGWLPPLRESAAAIERLKRAVEAAAQTVDQAVDQVANQVANQAASPRGDATLRACFLRTVRQLDAKNLRRDFEHLPTLLACVGLACERRLGLRPHAVQLAGARALLSGELAEMQTGEGKTLVAAMAATVMAATGARVHVISTNDYLARRDSEEMATLFGFFGLSVGCIQGGMAEGERRTAYAHPICYASGKEVVFDYLKDRLAGHGTVPARVARLHGLVQPDASPRLPLIPALHFAIVDEADSVMIDEARTPMILSREAPPLFDPILLDWALDAARRLEAGRHCRIGAGREMELRPPALAAAAAPPLGLPASWRSPSWREQLLRQALTALHLFHRDQHYILSEGKVQIVDESTGRVMPDRSWEHGLHQLIETKEGLSQSPGRETLARMTYQRFFRRYYLLAGLTGTAAEASRELWAVYRLRVRRIPPNRPLQRRRLADCCWPTVKVKWAMVADVAVAVAARGQPVLIGTRSVQASEQISAELTLRGVDHVVLNARQDAQEADIVAQAGAAGRITVATNMAGRGTDVRLDASALAAGGLHVILTEFHESRRVDRQLFGRSGRQGEPGSVQAIVSADDPLFERQPAGLRRWAASAALASGSALRWLVRRAQADAEQRAYRTRIQTSRHDRELHRLIGFAGKVT